MLKITTTLILFLIGMLTRAQFSEERMLSDFSKIDVKNGITVRYAPDEKGAFVTTNGNELPSNIVLEVKNGVLKVYSADNNPVADVTVTLGSNQLTAVTASNKASFVLTQILETRNLSIDLASGARFSGFARAKVKADVQVSDDAVFNGRIETGRLTGDFEDNSTVNLSGTAFETILTANGQAKLVALNLDVEQASILATENANVNMHAARKMTINVDGMAKVTYNGKPTEISYSDGALATLKDKNENGLSAK